MPLPETFIEIGQPRYYDAAFNYHPRQERQAVAIEPKEQNCHQREV